MSFETLKFLYTTSETAPYFWWDNYPEWSGDAKSGDSESGINQTYTESYQWALRQMLQASSSSGSYVTAIWKWIKAWEDFILEMHLFKGKILYFRGTFLKTMIESQFSTFIEPLIIYVLDAYYECGTNLKIIRLNFKEHTTW